MAYATTLFAILAGAGAGLYLTRKKKTKTNLTNWHKLKTAAEVHTFFEDKINTINAKTLSVPWVFFIAVPEGLTKRIARENPDLLFTSISLDVMNAFGRKVGGSPITNSWAVGSVPVTGPGAYQKEHGMELPLPVDENIINTFVIWARTGVMPEGATLEPATGTGLFGFMP